VSYSNGSNIALAHVDGDGAYRHLIYQLATEEDNYRISESARASRLVLHEMIRKLVTLATSRLEEPVDAAVVSLPCHTRVRRNLDFSVEEILRNALASTGVEMLRILPHSIWGEPLIYAENTQVAGHGLGLCQPYTAHDFSCFENVSSLAMYLLVGYYDNVLELTRTYEDHRAYDDWIHARPAYHLGLEAQHGNPGDPYYCRCQLVILLGE